MPSLIDDRDHPDWHKATRLDGLVTEPPKPPVVPEPEATVEPVADETPEPEAPGAP